MNSFNTWIMASRPHTLPLALSCVGIGNTLAWPHYPAHYDVLALSLLTAVLLQVLSNFANDYGDFVHGIDTDKRVGPKRSVQSGLVSAARMKNAVIIIAGAALVSGIGLLLLCARYVPISVLTVFFLAGISAVWAAWHYTASEKPYGYSGYGDLYVFIFFGWISVAGAYILQSGTFNVAVLLPASAYGLFSTGVLNLNNLRDIDNDAASGKNTLAVKLGSTKTKIYHFSLILSGMLMLIAYTFVMSYPVILYSFLIPCLLFVYHLFRVSRASSVQDYYSLLKQLSLIILFVSVIYSVGLMLDVG